jgi:hypothetical protein
VAEREYLLITATVIVDQAVLGEADHATGYPQVGPGVRSHDSELLTDQFLRVGGWGKGTWS